MPQCSRAKYDNVAQPVEAQWVGRPSPRPYVLVGPPEGLVRWLGERSGAVSRGQPRPLASSADRGRAGSCGKMERFPRTLRQFEGHSLWITLLALPRGDTRRGEQERGDLFPCRPVSLHARRSPQAAGLFFSEHGGQARPLQQDLERELLRAAVSKQVDRTMQVDVDPPGKKPRLAAVVADAAVAAQSARRSPLLRSARRVRAALRSSFLCAHLTPISPAVPPHFGSSDCPFGRGPNARRAFPTRRSGFG